MIGRSDANLIIKKLMALPEHDMRCSVLLEVLSDMQPREVLFLLSEVMKGVALRKPPCVSVLSVVFDVILFAQKQGGLYELLAEVYRIAREENEDEVADALVMAQPKQGPAPASKVLGDHELSELTLGERKSLARCHDKHLLDRLLFDPDPSVVRNILYNPLITERDVVRITSRRPALVENLREVYKSKWGERYHVRLSLVCNPYTPTDLSIKLVCFLLKKDLQAICRDGSLHTLVRRQASRLLDAKQDGGKEPIKE